MRLYDARYLRQLDDSFNCPETTNTRALDVGAGLSVKGRDREVDLAGPWPLDVARIMDTGAGDLN